MATIFIDGFDKYGVVSTNNNTNTPLLTTLLLEGEWNVVNLSGAASTYNIVAGLSSTGFALKLGPQGNVQLNVNKNLPASYTRFIGGFRFQSDLGGIVGVAFTDNGTVQSSIGILTTGAIRLYNGLFSATIVATSSVTISANSTHYLEWDITFGASASFNVYLDGASVFSGSTGNTKTTANANANGLAFVQNSQNPAGGLTVDDLYLFDPNTGSTNIAVLNTNPRIETRFPSSDSQTQWTNAGTVIVPINVSQTGVATTSNSNGNAGPNTLSLMKFTPSVNVTLQSVGTLPQTSNGAIKNKAVLYADSSGSPGALTATGTEVVGMTAATALTLPFAVGQSLTGGTTYWLGLITDTGWNVSIYDNNSRGETKANTYGSGAPNPAGTMTTGAASFLYWGNTTGATTNWESVAVQPANGPGPAADNGTITSSTVANEDLYGFPALSATANLIYTIALKANMKLPSGARTVDLRMNSAGTDSGGTNTGQAPGSGYTWLSTYFDTNPHGGAWNSTTANAATAGPKVAS